MLNIHTPARASMAQPVECHPVHPEGADSRPRQGARSSVRSQAPPVGALWPGLAAPTFVPFLLPSRNQAGTGPRPLLWMLPLPEMPSQAILPARRSSRDVTSSEEPSMTTPSQAPTTHSEPSHCPRHQLRPPVLRMVAPTHSPLTSTSGMRGHDLLLGGQCRSQSRPARASTGVPPPSHQHSQALPFTGFLQRPGPSVTRAHAAIQSTATY